MSKQSAVLFVRIFFVVAVGLWVFVGGLPQQACASSHREAPLISQDPAADNTDTYAFVSPDKPNTVTLVACYIPMESPAGGPNFFRFGDEVLYAIHVDNVGDAQDHVIFEFRFRTEVQNPNTFLYNVGSITSLSDPNLNVRQTYTVTRVDARGRTTLGSNLPIAPANIGPASTPNYDRLFAAAVQDLGNGV